MRHWFLLLSGLLLVITGCIWFDFETITDYKPPKPPPEEELADDRIEDRKPLTFDAALGDRRPLDGWLINNSAAVFKLDVPAEKPDSDRNLQTLHASYFTAVQAARQLRGEEILPSLNLLDGKAKQFDDGLYAAVDLAYYKGLNNHLLSHVDLIRALLARLKPESSAVPFLAAGLELAGVQVAVNDEAEKQRWLAEFLANETQSKPAGFYTWNEELKRCFRFLRFFQQEFGLDRMAVAQGLAEALRGDDRLTADYQRAVAFYRKLSNPSVCLALDQLPGSNNLADLTRACKTAGVSRQAVAVFPSSGSKESALFEKLFPGGLPPDANLMDLLVRRIRSGEIDLKPGDRSGWYDFQIHALETLLLPGRGEEHDKLLLTRNYKKRMLEAFKALMTKRRETHLRQMSVPLAMSVAAPPRMPTKISPRIRVEPVPTYYVRTARSYDFLLSLLELSMGKDGLRALHALRQDGPRPPDLHTDLIQQRDLFYGLYLLSCEDIGLKPTFFHGEEVNAEKCSTLAGEWLSRAFDDPDMKYDTRVCVPIFHDGVRKKTRLWATLGVRLRHLEVSYARPPSLKPKEGEGDWKPVESHRLEGAKYLVCVDEFAEVEVPGLRQLTREEFRKVCDRGKTKEGIVNLLKSYK